MPPVNDNLADAIDITGTFSITNGTTVGSTNEAEEIIQGYDYGAGDVWYKWTAPSNGFLKIKLKSDVMDGEIDIAVGDNFDNLNEAFNYAQLSGGIADVFPQAVISGTVYKIQIPYYTLPGPFSLELGFGVSSHTITATSGANGSINPSGATTVYGGALFVFTPNPGYEVSQVLVDGSPVIVSGNSYTFTGVVADHTISVSFVALPIVTIPINCGIFGVVTNQITGLDYLEGEIVSILADGEVLDQQVVQNGQITLPDNYAKVIVGLPYESDLETLNVELQDPEDTMQGKKIKIGNVTFRVINTRGGYVGPNEDVLYDAFTRVIIDKLGSEDLSLSYTGDLRVPLGAGYEDGGRVFYKQKQPLPVSIGAIIPELKVGGATG